MLVGRVVAGLRGAKGRDFDRLRSDVYVDQAEPAADDERAPEQRLHLLRPGVGGDVEILGLDAEQQVANRAADDECLEAGVLQLARDLERAAAQLSAADRMVGGAVDAAVLRALFLPGRKRANRRRIVTRSGWRNAPGKEGNPASATEFVARCQRGRTGGAAESSNAPR